MSQRMWFHFINHPWLSVHRARNFEPWELFALHLCFGSTRQTLGSVIKKMSRVNIWEVGVVSVNLSEVLIATNQRTKATEIHSLAIGRQLNVCYFTMFFSFFIASWLERPVRQSCHGIASFFKYGKHLNWNFKLFPVNAELKLWFLRLRGLLDNRTVATTLE